VTEVVVVFPAGAEDAAVDAVRAVIESHMAGFTDAARQQFVKRVARRLKEAAESKAAIAD
jgi:molybdopterin biosynthesis enzyme MoaB